jgi:hypothetical protein
MTAQVVVLDLDDADGWARAHADGGLPGQSWSFAHGLAAAGMRPQLGVVVAGGARMLVPFFERADGGVRDIATLLGLSGASLAPVPERPGEPPSPDPLVAWSRYAAGRGWVSGYLHFGTDLPPLPPEAGTVLSSGTVYDIDIACPDPFAGSSAIVRRKLRRAAADGATLVVDPDALAARLPALYRDSAWRRGASSAYALPDETLFRWLRAPDMVAVGAAIGGVIEAISLFPFAGARAEFHINAASERGRELSAWLIAAAADALRERGVATLNIGGGLTPGDSLDEFKQRFRGTPRRVHSIGQVHDPARFRALVAERGAAVASGWFPAYRAPIAASGARGEDGIAN